MIPTVQYLRENARRILRPDALIDLQARALEIDLLLAHSLGLSRLDLITKKNEPVAAGAEELFSYLLERRRRGEPVAYIVGSREFFGREFFVNPAVLIPRPETELIVEKALSQFKAGGGRALLIDIGTGSGAIILSILAELRERLGDEALRSITAIGADISFDALKVAAANRDALALTSAVKLVCSDLFEDETLQSELARPGYGLRLVVSNPPYVPQTEALPVDVADFEPETALRSGSDGLSIIRRIIAELEPQLSSDLRLLIECGRGQAESIVGMLRAAKAASTETFEDLAGIKRVAAANLNQSRSE